MSTFPTEVPWFLEVETGFCVKRDVIPFLKIDAALLTSYAL